MREETQTPALNHCPNRLITDAPSSFLPFALVLFFPTFPIRLVLSILLFVFSLCLPLYTYTQTFSHRNTRYSNNWKPQGMITQGGEKKKGVMWDFLGLISILQTQKQKEKKMTIIRINSNCWLKKRVVAGKCVIEPTLLSRRTPLNGQTCFIGPRWAFVFLSRNCCPSVVSHSCRRQMASYGPLLPSFIYY